MRQTDLADIPRPAYAALKSMNEAEVEATLAVMKAIEKVWKKVSQQMSDGELNIEDFPEVNSAFKLLGDDGREKLIAFMEAMQK